MSIKGRNPVANLQKKTMAYTFNVDLVNDKAHISLGCDEFAMGLQIDSPNRRELSRNVRMVS